MSQDWNRAEDYVQGQELLHTPGGVRDIYGIECARKLAVEEKVHHVMKSYGFRDIETPTFEYFDIFSKERGTVQSKEMFKFFDRGNNTLVLRPDVTPSIARCVAKYRREEHMPIRLCYTGNTFVNTSRYKGKLQEVTQVGAELFNDDTSDADAEMIAMLVECLKKSGLQEFQLEIGHADIFRGLVEEAGISEIAMEELRQLIVSKNFFGVEELLNQLAMPVQLKEIFVKLPQLLGDSSGCVPFVRERTQSARVCKALERLEKVEEILRIYGVSGYVTTDLSMLSQYSYYTGIVFRAYTYGNGEALATGGRYDGLVKQFGMDAPAIGLAIVTDQLLIALTRQKLFSDTALGGTVLLYPKELREKALELAEQKREQGVCIQMLRKSSKKDFGEYKDYAKRMGHDEILYLKKEDALTVFNVETGEESIRAV